MVCLCIFGDLKVETAERNSFATLNNFKSQVASPHQIWIPPCKANVHYTCSSSWVPACRSTHKAWNMSHMRSQRLCPVERYQRSRVLRFVLASRLQCASETRLPRITSMAFRTLSAKGWGLSQTSLELKEYIC